MKSSMQKGTLGVELLNPSGNELKSKQVSFLRIKLSRTSIRSSQPGKRGHVGITEEHITGRL